MVIDFSTKIKKDSDMAKIKRSARDFFPNRMTIPSLKKAAQDCRGCHLYKKATQTVFGEGSRNARRRLHRSPSAQEIHACIPWLEAEIEVIQPKVIVCLGAIAAKSILNKGFKLTEQRGKLFEVRDNIQAIATYHPSAILRNIDEESRHEMKKIFIKDLKKVAKIAEK